MSSQALWWRSFFSSTKQLLQHPPPPGAPAPRPGQGPEQRDPVGNRGPWGAQRSPAGAEAGAGEGRHRAITTLALLPLPPLVLPPPTALGSPTRGPALRPAAPPAPAAHCPWGLWVEGGARHSTPAPRRYPQGERAKGATVVVPTGAEQTVPIRINPHPSCWTGLLRTPPPGAVRRSSAQRRGISAVPAAMLSR